MKLLFKKNNDYLYRPVFYSVFKFFLEFIELKMKNEIEVWYLMHYTPHYLPQIEHLYSNNCFTIEYFKLDVSLKKCSIIVFYSLYLLWEIFKYKNQYFQLTMKQIWRKLWWNNLLLRVLLILTILNILSSIMVKLFSYHLS